MKTIESKNCNNNNNNKQYRTKKNFIYKCSNNVIEILLLKF